MANIGINCGMSGLVVVDVDTRDGKVGMVSLGTIVGGSYELIETGTVLTWSGGQHLYYSGSCPSSAGKLAPNIDIRGEGGYVVAPPSRIYENGSSGEYVWEKSVSLIMFPEIFRPPIHALNERDSAQFFKTGSRNNNLASLAGKMRNIGLEHGEIVAALQIANDERCDEPLPAKEVESIAGSIARYEPGRASDAIPNPPCRKRMTAEDLAARAGEQVEWLIEGLLRKSGIMLISAQPKVGKSDLARNLARSVATGEEFLARRCQQGSVIWIGLEEPVSHLKDRVDIMGLASLPIFYHVDSPEGDETAWLETLIREHNPTMVIIDTIGRFSKVADINSYSDVTRATQPILNMRNKYGTTFIVLHHNNKTSNAPLGSTMWSGFCDTIMSITRSADDVRTVRTTQRAGEGMEPTILRMDLDTGLITVAEPQWRREQSVAERNIIDSLMDGESATREELA